MEDVEMDALKKVYDAIKDLDEAGKKWVIDSMNRKFFRKEYPVSGKVESDANEITQNNRGDLKSFETLADAFAKASPKADSEKVLVVAAYLQEKEGRVELTSRDINKQLKHLGYNVSNITYEINKLKKLEPSMMHQTRKEGTTKQANKKYKVTVEGISKVNDMVN